MRRRSAAQQEADELRSKKNKIAKQIGALMGQGKKGRGRSSQG